MIDAISLPFVGEWVANNALMGALVWYLNWKISAIDKQLNNGISESLQQVREDVAYLRGAGEAREHDHQASSSRRNR